VTAISLELTPHQLRVSNSLAKLNIPSWCSDRPQSCKENQRWRREKRSKSSWRSKSGTQSCQASRSHTPDSVITNSSNLSFSKSTSYHWSYQGGKGSRKPRLPSTADSETCSGKVYKQLYLGWRCQEKQSFSYLLTPTQRLASTLLDQPHLSRIPEWLG
jgi:hypothetical protein